MLNLVWSFFSLPALDKFLLISAVAFWCFPFVYVLRSKMQVKRGHQEIDNKISVLEDICDRADIRISKLKHELSNLGSKPEEKESIKSEDISLPTYQAVVKRIQNGKSVSEIASETGIPLNEVKVLYRLIEASNHSQG